MSDEISPKQPELRASHQDRDRVVELLRLAAGEGRLTLDELDERLEKALVARTESDLVALTADLPATAGGAPAPKDRVQIDVGSGSAKRNGTWVVPRAVEVSVTSGSVTLDLTKAIISFSTLQVEATVKSGVLKIVTRPGIEVDADDVTVRSGSVKVRRPPATEPAPATFLRVQIAGSVKSGAIIARPPRRSLWAWLLRRPHSYS